MIDLALLRENPGQTKQNILKKEPSFNVELLISLDQEVRQLKLEVEQLRHRKNELAKEAGKNFTENLRSESIELGKKLKNLEEVLQKKEAILQKIYLECPNIPDESVPEGNKESNKIVKMWGKKKEFNFTPKNHLELCDNPQWIDFNTASKLAGSNFAFYGEEGAKLLYALSFFMLKNNTSRGFSLCLPSLLVNEKALTVSGNFPKFRENVFEVENHHLFLTPTSEVNLTNTYADHIFSMSDLPIRKTAWTSCFRTEGGGYGAHERGLIRLKQFEKVELVSFTTPENSMQELEYMLETAEMILQKLDLHYRVMLLAGQDCSFQSAKTFDIEVWLPGQNEYKEISSASNCTDFQARRGLIRYKKSVNDKTQLVHTLNASSLALPRLMVAIIETYQNSDGTIEVPDILKPYYL